MESLGSRNIINELNEDSEKAMKLIFTAYYPRLSGFVSRFIDDPEDVRDIVQDVFLNIYEKRGKLKNISLHSLLFTMARNACINYLKHQTNKKKHIEKTLGEKLYYADFIENENYEFLLTELQQQIDMIIDKLPERTKKAYLLYSKNNMKNTDIAEEMGITVKMVDRHIRKALTLIKEQSSLNKTIIAIMIIINS